MSARAHAASENLVEADRVADLKLKGFAKPVMAYAVKRLKPGGRALLAGRTDAPTVASTDATGAVAGAADAEA
jgi:hypothetical protein